MGSRAAEPYGASGAAGIPPAIPAALRRARGAPRGPTCSGGPPDSHPRRGGGRKGSDFLQSRCPSALAGLRQGSPEVRSHEVSFSPPGERGGVTGHRSQVTARVARLGECVLPSPPLEVFG